MKKPADGLWLPGISAALYGLPFLLAMSACAGVDLRIVTAIFAVYAYLGTVMKRGVIPGQTYAFLPCLYVVSEYGLTAGLIAAAAAAVFTAVLIRLPAQRLFNRHIRAGVLFALAFCATALLTTYYFGIGASGNTVAEILKAYRYLGFHPNWRGILYGTITLVLMITYPRKFKKLKNYIPAPFAAIVIPYILNLFLNPVKEATAIAETSSLYCGVQFTVLTLSGGIYALVGGLASALVLFWLRGGEHGLVYGAPSLHRLHHVQVSPVFTAAVYTAILAAVTLTAHALLVRIPLPSLAVVLIAAGWQAVDWKGIAGAFKGGWRSCLSFILVLAGIFLLDAAAAVLLAAALSVVFSGVRICSKK